MRDKRFFFPIFPYFAISDARNKRNSRFFKKDLDKSDKIVYNTIVFRGIAQLVEYWSPKPWVVGSSPSAPAKKFDKFRLVEFFYPLRKQWHIITL